MADQTPPGPQTSGRIAGVIALVALVLGGYYAVVARPAPTGSETPAPAQTAAAPAADAAKEEAAKSAPADQAAPAAAADSAKSAAEAKNASAGSAPKDTSAAAASAEPAKDAGGDSAKSESAKSETQSAEAAAPAGDKAAKDAAKGTTAAPSFDVVRVEPTGEAVVAGLAEPKAEVELLDGSTPIAKGEANDRGEWAIVVEKPLAPGTHDLSIRTTSADKKTQTLSEQRVAIEVPQPGKGDALIVLNQPDQPSRVLQMPEEPKMAAGDTAPTAGADGKNVAAPAAGAEQKMASAETPKSGDVPKPADGAAAGAAATADSGQGATAGEEAPAAASESTAAKDVPAPDAAAKDAAAKDAAAKDTASASSAPAAPDAAAPAQMTAEAQKEPSAATAGADQAATAGATAATEPAAGAEKPAASEQAAAPAPAAADQTAKMQEPAKSEAATNSEAAAKSEPAVKAAVPAPEPKVTVDAVEFENGTIYVAGSAATGGVVRIYVDGVAIGDAQTADGGRWLLETKHDMKPGQHSVRADQIEKDSGNVIVRAEVPFEQTVDVAILAPVTTGGGGSEGASASGTMPGPQNVIIRRGDNLWTISRRLYGKGIRYSTIYEANTEQIRNPHWIYPGQIFTLPAGDSRWTN